MTLILVIILIVLLFGGGGYYGYSRGTWGGPGISVVGVLLIIIVFYLLFPHVGRF